MTKISMDIKQMPVNKGYSHILVLLCEVTNYMVALPLMSTRTPHILEAFRRGYLAYFGPPTHIVCDQDPAFTSSLMEAFVTQLNIKVILVSPTNHQSLQAEHGIKKFVRFVSETPVNCLELAFSAALQYVALPWLLKPQFEWI